MRAIGIFGSFAFVCPLLGLDFMQHKECVGSVYFLDMIIPAGQNTIIISNGALLEREY